MIASTLPREGVTVKYIWLLLFCEMKKARSLLQNFGLTDNKNGRQVFSDLPAVSAVIQLYGSSDPLSKQKWRFYIFKYASRNPGIWQQKPRQNRGFCGTYLFYVPFMVRQEGFEPSTLRLKGVCSAN